MSLWTHGAEPADVGALEKELQAVVSSQDHVAVLMIVEATSPIATVGAQSKAVAMVQALGAALRTVCIVIEGEGVQAAAVRSVFVALATMLRPRFRWKTFATRHVRRRPTVTPRHVQRVPHVGDAGFVQRKQRARRIPRADAVVEVHGRTIAPPM
jgi:hypothetical protein